MIWKGGTATLVLSNTRHVKPVQLSSTTQLHKREMKNVIIYLIKVCDSLNSWEFLIAKLKRKILFNYHEFLSRHRWPYAKEDSTRSGCWKKAKATWGCIAYVTHDIILPPNTAPVSLRGTIATHSEHRSSSQRGTAAEKPQENNHQM